MSTIAVIIKDLDWCFERTDNEGYHLISYKDWQTLKAAVLAQQPNNTGMAAEAAKIAAEMNDVLQSGVLNHQAINWVTHWAQQLRHA